MNVVDYQPGSSPLLLSMPHCGTHIPASIAMRMSEAGLRVADTDWHVDILYDFAQELGAHRLRPAFSRYVIDLNRAPDGEALYPGASNTELCPITTFDQEPIYRHGSEPDAAEVGRRRKHYWQPYHRCLADALGAIRRQHGIALLFDAHSIRSVVPRFFQGRLPDLNLGTADGSSCDGSLQQALGEVLAGTADYTHVVNGRFKGGYITRVCGRPGDGFHAVQLELAQCAYMDEDPPFAFRPDLADRLRPTLRALLERMLEWAATR